MEGLARLMLHVKCELDQLDDLFNSHSFLNSSVWKVLFSANFRKSFAKLKSLQMKKKVIQTILGLASGWRSKRNYVTLSDSFQLAKIYRMGEHYLVWTIDIVMDERYIQVIKIWDILLLSQLMSFISRIDRIFSMYTDSYISRCKEKCTDGIEVPVSWNSNQNILQYKKHCELELAENAKLGQIDGEEVLENSKVSESLLLMKFYALTSGIVSHLLTGNDGTELNIPFELTDEEKHVVRFSRSSFILGRSGTGKTTILTTKLVQKQQQHTLALQGVCVLEGDLSRDAFRNDSVFENDERLQKKKMLKQVFITVSPKLCLAIQDHINRLTSFAASGCLYGPSNIEMRDTSDLLAQFVDIPDTFHDLPNKHFPLVVTFSKFLMMLDGSISRSFFSKFRNDQDLSINGSNASKSLALQMFFQKEVDFEKFVGSYWPHFSTQLTKKLDACSVYTEIISHIKGDLEAGSFLDGKLGRRDYIMLANKRVSPFCEDMRGDIYDIFLDYEKKKCLNGEFDIADFVIDLHQRLRCGAHLGDKFDYVYVDEVQDLTMRQVALLKYCCTNYDEGFVFAGDTAQTIARGVDFRFEDIRCLFYKEFTSELRIEDHGLKKGERIKDNFQLNQNFRTHSGVLKLAKSIMDLLFNFFPLSIDRIAPEISLIYGESPVLLKSTNDENAIITIFGSGTGECSNMIEFGAEQVILVRDDIAKSQIVDLVGTKALVLTIIECKGLEFQDVLLYNFFGGSPLKNKWRVVYKYMNENGFADQSGMTACPSFDHGRHGLLCSELKQLYVAITRTRQRLWISENSYEFCKPIFDYWKSLCLVQVRHLDSSLAQAMQAISTSDDWRVRGIKLFNEENFEMATMCFERAGDIYREKWARAAGLVSSADSILSSKPEMAKAVLKAADIYESIGKPESAATCYIKLKDFNSAGRLYLEKCGEASLEAAGDCFSMAEKWLLAADVYAKAKCFSKCLSMCSQGELFDAGLRFIKQWTDDSDFDTLKQHELCKVEKSFLESCVMHYVTLRDITHMVELAKVLQSMDLIRNSLKSRGLLDELLELEMVMGNYIEAADLAHVKGNILLEADMLQKAGHFEKSAGVILLHVIVNSLWAPGSKGWPLKQFAKKEEFLDKAKVIAKQVSDSFYDIVSSEAYLLSDCSKDLFNLSRHLVKAHKFQNIRLEIFTLREIIDIHLQFEPCKYVWEPGLVSDVDKHTHLIMSQNICSVESLMHNWKLWKNKILKVLSHLSSSTQFKENDFELYEQFCFEYLGILMNSDQNTFFLLNPEASWTNSCKNSPKLRDLSMINFGQFKESAHRYWRLELLSLGVEILEKLELLISFSKCCVKACSHSKTTCNVFERKVLFPFSKARVILATYEIVKFIREFDTISLESIDKISRIFTSSSEYFFSILFPIMWKDGSNMSMLDFHTSMNVMEIIEESIDRDLRPFEGKMTLGQITRLVMLLFLTGNLKDGLFYNIIQQLSFMQPWHDLIITFKGFLSSSSQSISLILKLEQALRDSFFTDWKGKCDFMSPHCFMYLVDCLLFCASSCLGSRVPFFSTKSTLFEMLRCRGLKGYMDTFFVVPCDSPTFISVHNCLESIIEMIQMLLKRKGEIKAWVVQSSMCQFDYCSLITKMVITLCLANLNSGRSFYLNKFLSHNYIMDDLPEKFRDAIAGCWEVRKNLIDFSNALRVAQDSLVYVIPRDKKIDFSNLNTIVLKPEDLRCCEYVIAKLFPKISKNEPKIQCEQELPGSISSGDVHNMCQTVVFAYSKSLIQAELLQKNEQVDLAMIIDQDDLQKTCLQLCMDLNTRLRSYDEIKLEDIIHCLSTLIAWISQNVQQRDSDPDIQKIRKMVIEIKFHSSSLDGGIEPPCMTVEELELRCPGWKFYLSSFIDSMLKEMNKSPETIVDVVEEEVICEETTNIANNSSTTVSEVVDEDIFKETTDITDNSSEIVAAVIEEEDSCKETADIADYSNKNQGS
ncbi:hypothetical protein KSP40_PGU012011 [Platanthera guangdongensis]|uniref:UvrD-like helicase ATP-binding domain-containing protein n=1 Tax=Platanthera guangdongensis TaxID=2320717 RepID=A0ABR2MNV4_9ASPA